MTGPLLAFVLVGSLFATGAAVPAKQKLPVPPVPVPQKGPDGVDPKMPYFQVCAKECDDCARSCNTCAAHCAKMLADGRKEHLDTLKLCQDCATLCTAASQVVAKDGPTSDLICTACAEACKRCGDACEAQAGDPILKQCAEECRKCEKVCRAMAKGSAVTPPKPKEP
jgi:hypothetical protein